MSIQSQSYHLRDFTQSFAFRLATASFVVAAVFGAWAFYKNLPQTTKSVAPRAAVFSQKYGLSDKIQISMSGDRENVDPTVAWTGQNFLVVWMSGNDEGFDIHGSVVSPQGAVLTEDLVISGAADEQYYPSVACGDTVCLVVWQDLRAGGATSIYVVRVALDGKVMDQDGFPVSVGQGNRDRARVGWDGKNFLVVWQQENPAPTQSDIVGARVSPDGKVLDPDGILISGAEGNQNSPSIAWGKDEYLVVWTDHRFSDADHIYGAHLSAAGRVIEPEGIPINWDEGDKRYPHVTWDGEGFRVVWAHQNKAASETEPQDAVIRGVALSSVGLSPSLDLSEKKNFRTFPAVVSLGSSEDLVLWEEIRDNSGRGIYASLLDSRGEVEDLNKIEVDPPTHPEDHRFVKGARGTNQTLLVWHQHGEQMGSIHGRVISEK